MVAVHLLLCVFVIRSETPSFLDTAFSRTLLLRTINSYLHYGLLISNLQCTHSSLAITSTKSFTVEYTSQPQQCR